MVQKHKQAKPQPKNNSRNEIRELSLKLERALREKNNPYIIHVRERTRKAKLSTDEPMPISKPIPRDYTIVGIMKGNKMYLGYSVCGERDNFNKADARLRAMERAEKQPYKTVTLSSKTKNPGKKFVENAYKFMEEMPHLFDKQMGIERAIDGRN